MMVSCLTSCSGPDPLHEEGLVYGVVLDKTFERGATLELYDTTMKGLGYYTADRPSPAFDPDAFESYEALGEGASDPLMRPIDAHVIVRLTANTPETGAELSHVGFDDHFLHAIVLQRAYFDGEEGEVTLFQLEPRDGLWEIELKHVFE